MRTWPRCASHLVILEETHRRGRQSAAHLARLTKRLLAAPAGDQGRPNRIALRAQALAFLRDDRGSGKGEITWLTMHVVSNTSRAREIMGGVIGRICVRRRFAGRWPVLAGIASSRHRCRNWRGRLLSREQKPAGSSTGARCSPLSGQEIRWRLCRGCA